MPEKLPSVLLPCDFHDRNSSNQHSLWSGGVEGTRVLALSTLSGIFHWVEKTGSEGQLGPANLLREKLNVLSTPINTPLCGDDGGLLGLEIECLCDMTLSSEH